MKNTAAARSTVKRYAIGVDIGASKTAIGICDSNGHIITKSTLPTGVPAELPEQIRALLAEAHFSPEKIRGIGVGAVGPLDLQRGTILDTPNLPAWRGVPIVKILKRAFEVAVVLDNDANAAALAELKFGHRKKNFIYLTLSTGIGGGIVIDGKLYRGATGNAGEVGHMILESALSAPKCGCGKRGCLEALASGSAIAKCAKTLLKLKYASAEIVSQRAHAGDAKARRIIEEAAFYLGVGLANLSEIFDPELIVLGGGLTKAWALFEKSVKKGLRRYARQAPDLTLTKLGDDNVLMGAAALVFSRL